MIPIIIIIYHISKIGGGNLKMDKEVKNNKNPLMKTHLKKAHLNRPVSQVEKKNQ